MNPLALLAIVALVQISPPSELVVNSDAFPIKYGHLGVAIDEPACYLSGSTSPGENAPTVLPSWDVSDVVNVNLTEARSVTADTNSTSCGRGKNGKWGFYTTSCLTADCTQQVPAGRTAQMLWGMSGYRKPFATPGGALKASVDFQVTRRHDNGKTAQFGLAYVALRDTRGTENRDDDIRIWYTVSLWDSRGQAIKDHPPVMSDWFGGGGTPFFNVLGYLDGENSRHATQIGKTSTFGGGTHYEFLITADHLAKAVADINTFISSDPIYAGFPLYSTDLSNYEWRAAAVDVEINERNASDGFDFVAFTVDNFKVEQIGGTK